MRSHVDRHKRSVITGQGHVVGTGVLVPLHGMAVRRSFDLVLLVQVFLRVLLQRLIDGFLAYRQTRWVTRNLTFIWWKMAVLRCLKSQWFWSKTSSVPHLKDLVNLPLVSLALENIGV